MKAGKHIPRLLVILVLFSSAGLDLKALSELKLDPPTTTIPKAFFGVGLLRFSDGPHRSPGTYVGAWRSFDANWRKVEPERGQWEFSTIDGIVADAVQHSVDLDLILGTSPTWASARPNEKGNPIGARAESSNMADWSNYIETVAMRYKGRVHTYELWNEPNQPSSYSGDIEHLVTLCRIAYQILKKVDPTITVLSPGFSPYLDQAYIAKFLSMGGKNTFDVFAYHFYTESTTPEKEIILKQAIDKILGADSFAVHPRVWNTEAGYLIESSPMAHHNAFQTFHPTEQVLTGRQSQAFIVRSFVLAWALGIQRYYWYAWGENHYALVDDLGDTDKPATKAFRNLSNRLVGSRMLSCRRTKGGLWNVHLQEASGKSFWIVWSDSSPQRLEGPAVLHIARAQNIDGVEVPRMAIQTIGGDPVFIDEE